MLYLFLLYYFQPFCIILDVSFIRTKSWILFFNQFHSLSFYLYLMEFSIYGGLNLLSLFTFSVSSRLCSFFFFFFTIFWIKYFILFQFPHSTNLVIICFPVILDWLYSRNYNMSPLLNNV